MMNDPYTAIYNPLSVLDFKNEDIRGLIFIYYDHIFGNELRVCFINFFQFPLNITLDAHVELIDVFV